MILFTLIIFGGCSRSDKFTVDELPDSDWSIKFKGIDRKKSTIGFPKDSAFLRKIPNYWPLIISKGNLFFGLEDLHFANRDYSIKGRWGSIASDSIWIIGNKYLWSDTIFAKFNEEEDLLFMTISKAQVINMEMKDEIELFGGENIILELKDWYQVFWPKSSKKR